MLYLTRVQKKGLFGHAELQLLARQTGEYTWSPIKSTEILVSSEANAHSLGVLLLVEVNEDRQISQIEEASQKLVEILSTLSQSGDRLMDMSEIERWRQSLTRQSQELSRRETEIEARQEQLQQWENTLRKRQIS